MGRVSVYPTNYPWIGRLVGLTRRWLHVAVSLYIIRYYLKAGIQKCNHWIINPTQGRPVYIDVSRNSTINRIIIGVVPGY